MGIESTWIEARVVGVKIFMTSLSVCGPRCSSLSDVPVASNRRRCSTSTNGGVCAVMLRLSRSLKTRGSTTGVGIHGIVPLTDSRLTRGHTLSNCSKISELSDQLATSRAATFEECARTRNVSSLREGAGRSFTEGP